MTPRKEKMLKLAHNLCEDCGWYNDCPAGYNCPPLCALIELIIDAPEEEEE